MTTNTVDDDVDRSATNESKENDLGKDNRPSPEQDNRPSPETDLSSEMDSLRERLMRALAETENTRRQGERRAQDAEQYAIAKFARELLQVADNLRRAIEASATDAEATKGTAGLIEGVAATDRILTQILDRFGVREIDALNGPFDPEKHEAVMESDETEQPPGRVVQVLENGYMLHDRLLRPARVVVAKPQQSSSSAAQQ